MISKGGANMAKEQLSAALSEQMEYEKLNRTYVDRSCHDDMAIRQRKNKLPATVWRPEFAKDIDRIENAVNTNNSDIDLCEFGGKTVIVYSWGNQLGHEFLAIAEYDGSEEEFLKSFF